MMDATDGAPLTMVSGAAGNLRLHAGPVLRAGAGSTRITFSDALEAPPFGVSDHRRPVGAVAPGAATLQPET